MTASRMPSASRAKGWGRGRGRWGGRPRRAGAVRRWPPSSAHNATRPIEVSHTAWRTITPESCSLRVTIDSTSRWAITKWSLPRVFAVGLFGVGLAGIEPATSALSVLRSNRLSYSPGRVTGYRARTQGYTLSLTRPQLRAHREPDRHGCRRRPGVVPRWFSLFGRLGTASCRTSKFGSDLGGDERSQRLGPGAADR
jgi:hypothetical protein